MRKSLLGLLAAVMAGGLLGCSESAADGNPSQVLAAAPRPTIKVILDTQNSFWRFRTVRETEEVILPSGKVDHVRFTYPRDWFTKHPNKIEVDTYVVEKVNVVRLPAGTSPDWMRPDFDDSTWVRSHGPMLAKSNDLEWKLVLARGRFEVADPARAGDLRLSVTFRGGCIVYLNGEELTRAFMPPGEITPETAAAPYPTEVYLDDKGYAVWPHNDKEVYQDRYSKRVRELPGFKIPPSKLKKGANLLAIGIHRAPTDPAAFLRRLRTSPRIDSRSYWCKVGLIDLSLVASPRSAAVPNVARQADKGFVAWNHSIMRKVYTTDYPDPFAPLAPIRLSGVRNGTFAGQMVVGHDVPINGLNAKATALTGAGTIPASAVRIRYALPDGPEGERGRFCAFDSLEETPPPEVRSYKECGNVIQPIWITVTVPPDARPGEYTGRVTVSAKGVRPIVVPLKLKVADWTLPDASRFTARMDLVESPESVAMGYKVPLWSDEHFKLLEKTFSLLAPLAAKTLYITCIRRTHFGNEHAMVRWFRGPDGELHPDFSVAERYLDVATRHLGKVPGVVLYCWEPTTSMGHAGVGMGRTHDRPILITLVDPKTGALRKMKGPAWGSPEARAFWRRLTSGMSKVLERRGMPDSMLLGLIGDHRPTKNAMDDITTGVPDARWAVHSHHYCDNWQTHKIGFCSALWGIHIQPMDPSVNRSYGWRNPFWLAYYPREMSMQSPVVEHRIKLENWLGAGSGHYTTRSAWGLGRLGADFWKVARRKRGSRYASLAGRYPESYWGQLNLNYGIPHLLGMGADGPVATVRSEAFRENVQEVEARIFIEKALLDEARRARLGDEVARRCREALDERIRMCLHAHGEGLAWFISSGWKERTDKLFRLAAEVAAKLKT